MSTKKVIPKISYKDQNGIVNEADMQVKAENVILSNNNSSQNIIDYIDECTNKSAVRFDYFPAFTQTTTFRHMGSGRNLSISCPSAQLLYLGEVYSYSSPSNSNHIALIESNNICPRMISVILNTSDKTYRYEVTELNPAQEYEKARREIKAREYSWYVELPYIFIDVIHDGDRYEPFYVTDIYMKGADINVATGFTVGADANAGTYADGRRHFTQQSINNADIVLSPSYHDINMIYNYNAINTFIKCVRRTPINKNDNDYEYTYSGSSITLKFSLGTHRFASTESNSKLFDQCSIVGSGIGLPHTSASGTQLEFKLNQMSQTAIYIGSNSYIRDITLHCRYVGALSTGLTVWRGYAENVNLILESTNEDAQVAVCRYGSISNCEFMHFYNCGEDLPSDYNNFTISSDSIITNCRFTGIRARLMMSDSIISGNKGLSLDAVDGSSRNVITGNSSLKIFTASENKNLVENNIDQDWSWM